MHSIVLVWLLITLLLPVPEAQSQPAIPAYPPGAIPLCAPDPPTVLFQGLQCVSGSGTIYAGDSTDSAVAQGGEAAGGAPLNATYLLATANGALPNAIVVSTGPGGEVGGTWAAITVNATHAGSSHAQVQAAAEATAAAALTTHAATITNVHGVNGAVVGTTDTQTLSNKTLAAPIAQAAHLQGISTYTGFAVNDNDCTGQQGQAWWDSTENRFEWCNANSGVPATLAAPGTGGLGINLSSTTNDILSTNGTLVLGGTGATFNERLTLNFELANEIELTSTSGITLFDFGALAVQAAEFRSLCAGAVQDCWIQLGTETVAPPDPAIAGRTNLAVHTVADTSGDLEWRVNGQIPQRVIKSTGNQTLTGVLSVTDGVAAPDRMVSVSLDTRTLTVADVQGQQYVNIDSGDGYDDTLPAAQAGLHACWRSLTGEVLILDPPPGSGDQIILDGTVFSAERQIESDGAAFSRICLRALNDTYWEAYDIVGNWVEGASDALAPTIVGNAGQIGQATNTLTIPLDLEEVSGVNKIIFFIVRGEASQGETVSTLTWNGTETFTSTNDGVDTSSTSYLEGGVYANHVIWYLDNPSAVAGNIVLTMNCPSCTVPRLFGHAVLLSGAALGQPGEVAKNTTTVDGTSFSIAVTPIVNNVLILAGMVNPDHLLTWSAGSGTTQLVQTGGTSLQMRHIITYRTLATAGATTMDATTATAFSRACGSAVAIGPGS